MNNASRLSSSVSLSFSGFRSQLRPDGKNLINRVNFVVSRDGRPDIPILAREMEEQDGPKRATISRSGWRGESGSR